MKQEPTHASWLTRLLLLHASKRFNNLREKYLERREKLLSGLDSRLLCMEILLCKV
jgi:hypothetical protein